MSAINVTAQNNSGGFTGGGMHLRNTGHLFPGQPLRGLLIRNNTCAGAGGVVVLGGERRLRGIAPTSKHMSLGAWFLTWCCFMLTQTLCRVELDVQ